MERISHPKRALYAISVATLFITPGILAAQSHQLPHYQSAPADIITPDDKTATIPEEYRNDKPQPLMRGDGFNYNLYYNYRLTPHVILRPNLQQTTKPGSVSDNSHLFVGGLSAGINF